MTEPHVEVAGRPCSASRYSLPCPWRRDTAGSRLMPPRLATEDFRRFCGTEQQEAPPDAGFFICHKSQPGRPIVCAGWLAAVGHHHIGVRLAVCLGWIPADRLENPPDGPPLFSTFEAMVAGHIFAADAADRAPSARGSAHGTQE